MSQLDELVAPVSTRNTCVITTSSTAIRRSGNIDITGPTADTDTAETRSRRDPFTCEDGHFTRFSSASNNKNDNNINVNTNSDHDDSRNAIITQTVTNSRCTSITVTLF